MASTSPAMRSSPGLLPAPSPPRSTGGLYAGACKAEQESVTLTGMTESPRGMPMAQVEVYSTFLRIRGGMEIRPPLRLSDEVNRLQDYLELNDTTTEPLLTSYPVVSPRETNTTIAKAAVVMITAETGPPQHNPAMWKEKVRHHVVLNTTAFALAADLHLEPRISLAQHLAFSPREFLPITRVTAVVVASLAGSSNAQPQTLQRDFALVNPANIVSFSVREATEPAGGGTGQ